jgi:hypothetical protein
MTAAPAPAPRDRPRRSAAEQLHSVPQLANDPSEIRNSPQGDAERSKGAHTVALWSRSTAREIETMLLEDHARGVLSAVEAAEMIARVWDRVEPEAVSDARRLDVIGRGTSR